MHSVNKKEISTALRCLRHGGVLAVPTDTVHGLVGLARLDVKKRIYRIKQRSARKPLPLFVADITMARRFAHISVRQEQFLKKVWPGQVTVIVRNKKNLSGFKTSTIALRVPDDRFLLAVLKKVNAPLTGTSANISGNTPFLRAAQIIREFKNKRYRPDIVIQGNGSRQARTVYSSTLWRGTKEKGAQKKKALSSTVVDIRGHTPRIIRKGPISLTKIKKAWRGVSVRLRMCAPKKVSRHEQ